MKINHLQMDSNQDIIDEDFFEVKEEPFADFSDVIDETSSKSSPKNFYTFNDDEDKGKCLYCGDRVFPLKLHLRKCVALKKIFFTCTLDDCKSSFETERHLRGHIRKFHTQLMKCPEKDCDMSFEPISLSQHLKTVHQKLKEQCKFCRKHVLDLRRHLLWSCDVDEQKHKCFSEDCQAKFKSKNGLFCHMKVAHQYLSIKCPHENCESFLKSTSLIHHLKYVHQETKKTCGNCGKQISFLKSHLKTCLKKNEEKKFFCTEENCKSAFSTNRALKIHIKITHVPLIKCPREDCDTFLKPVAVSRHIKIFHDKIKRQCKNCGKLLSLIFLRQHEAECSDESRRFFCSFENCTAAFRKKNHLNSHFRKVHTSPIKCPYRDCKKYLKPSHLKEHVLKFHAIKKTLEKTCTNCGKQVTYLKSHYRRCISNGAKVFSCKVKECKAFFQYKHELMGHTKAVHQEWIKCPVEHCASILQPASLANHLKWIHQNKHNDDVELEPMIKLGEKTNLGNNDEPSLDPLGGKENIFQICFKTEDQEDIVQHCFKSEEETHLGLDSSEDQENIFQHCFKTEEEIGDTDALKEPRDFLQVYFKAEEETDLDNEVGLVLDPLMEQ